MRSVRRTQTFNINRTIPFSSNPAINCVGRNLEKYQLGGVIFGCKNSTLKECQSKQLFGLPTNHFSYVKNIDPGLPIFLFNYSDRKLHGIFEASSKGKMYIDPYAWIDDNSDLDRTQYPAQVKVRVRLQCKPLSEDQFSRVIAENYYKNNHFWFELDHRQANKLTSLLASFAFASGCHLRQKTISQSLSSTLKEGEAFETHESETKSLTSLSKTTIATEITSLDGDIKSLDVVRVETEEMNIIYEKLKEWAHESQDLPISDHLDDTEDETEMFTLEKHENDENEMDIEELMELTLVHENPDISVSDHTNDTPHENDICTIRNDYGEVPTGSEEKEKSSSPLIDHQNTIIFDELMQEVEELKTFKKIQTQTNCYLDDMLREAELKIQHLIDRCTMLELAFNLPPPHAEKTSITSYAEQRVDPTETSFLKGNFNEEAWLSTIDLYCPAERVITLYPVNSAHSCASMVQLNVGSYSPIFDKRTLCPSLNQSKGNLAVLSLNDQMFAVDCANGIDSFSDIEVFDLDNGRWISAHSHSMIDKAFAIAAAEFNNWFHTTFGNGINYLKFFLGGFDGNKKVPSIKVFDPSFDMDDGGTNKRKTLLTLTRNICGCGKSKLIKTL
ncbi:B2 protein [Glycine max]|nr:B2 protein [Glycine max]|eukprot:XP_025979536.1 uncharacterized protein LOC102660492 [Glycine max]